MEDDRRDERLARHSSARVAREVFLATGISLTPATVRAWRVNGLPRWGVARIREVLDRLEREAEVARGR